MVELASRPPDELTEVTATLRGPDELVEPLRPPNKEGGPGVTPNVLVELASRPPVELVEVTTIPRAPDELVEPPRLLPNILRGPVVTPNILADPRCPPGKLVGWPRLPGKFTGPALSRPPDILHCYGTYMRKSSEGIP